MQLDSVANDEAHLCGQIEYEQGGAQHRSQHPHNGVQACGWEKCKRGFVNRRPVGATANVRLRSDCDPMIVVAKNQSAGVPCRVPQRPRGHATHKTGGKHTNLDRFAGIEPASAWTRARSTAKWRISQGTRTNKPVRGQWSPERVDAMIENTGFGRLRLDKEIDKWNRKTRCQGHLRITGSQHVLPRVAGMKQSMPILTRARTETFLTIRPILRQTAVARILVAHSRCPSTLPLNRYTQSPCKVGKSKQSLAKICIAC